MHSNLAPGGEQHPRGLIPFHNVATNIVSSSLYIKLAPVRLLPSLTHHQRPHEPTTTLGSNLDRSEFQQAPTRRLYEPRRCMLIRQLLTVGIQMSILSGLQQNSRQMPSPAPLLPS